MDDEKLNALLAADAPPASDPCFVLEVLARVERRRFRRELATTAGLTIGAVALLAWLAPLMEVTWRDSFAPYASNLAILLALMGITLAMPYFFAASD